MRKLGILIFMLITVLLLTSCGIETNIRSNNSYSYITKYNEKYYFQVYNPNSSYISYLKNGDFIKVKDISEYRVVGSFNNKVLLKLTTNDTKYIFLNLDSLEYSNVNLSNWDGLINISYLDNDFIVFRLNNGNQLIRFLIYSIKDEKVVAEKSFDTKKYYRYESVYYENNKLYVHFNYASVNASNYDYIYDIYSDTVTKVISVMGNDKMVVEDQTLLFFRASYQYTNYGIWVTTGSSEEDYFDSAGFRALKIYNNFIVGNQFYNDKINILNDELIMINEYKIKYECDSGYVINDEELICKQTSTYGALIKSRRDRYVIYNFKSDEIIDEIEWFVSSNQFNGIMK